MKIGLYDPYLDTMGGGEKYILQAAEHLSKNHEVSVFWNPEEKNLIDTHARERFGFSLEGIYFTKNIFSPHISTLERMMVTSMYDCLFIMSDGSVPLLCSKKNIIMFQHPVDWVNGMSFMNKMKFQAIRTVVCNSYFVKSHIDATFGVESRVITPPVISVKRDEFKKEKIILSVGRFTNAMNTKKQGVLIQAFKLFSKSTKGWQLVLIGGAGKDDESLIEALRNEAKGHNVHIYPNVPYATLCEYYNRASFYWHAAGYHENISVHAERTEHFGISTVEAMSAGCIPVVFRAGGQLEIVEEGKSGFLWKTTEELIEKTKKTIHNSHAGEIQKNAEKRADLFNESIFYNKIDELIRM